MESYRRKSLRMVLAAIFLFVGTMAMASEKELVGDWNGTLDTGAQQLRVMFKISQGETGLTAVLVSVDQGGAEIPCDSITFEENSVAIEIAQLQGNYKGTLSEDKMSMDGNWSQRGNTLPLKLTKEQ